MLSMESEWAAEAVKFEAEYVEGVLNAQPRRFFDDDDAAYEMFRRWFPGMDVRELKVASDAERYAEDREWRSLMARLTLADGKILTPLRIDAGRPDQRRLVPRTVWACIELARSREGVYDAKTLAGLRQLEENNEQVTKVSVRDDEGDRRVVADCEVDAGELLFVEDVLCVAPYDFTGFGSGGACFHCGRMSSDVVARAMTSRECSGIPAFAYCSPACERRYAESHAIEWTAAKHIVFEQHDLPAFKLLLALRAVLSSEEQIRHLKSHAELMDDAYKTKVEKATRAVAKILGKDIARDLENAVYQVDINAIALGSGACGFAPRLVAMCNHSCLETATHYATWDDDRPQIIVRSVIDLHPGDDIDFCYLGETDLAEPTHRRRAILQTTKHFTCHCVRCDDPDLDDAMRQGSDDAARDVLAEARFQVAKAEGIHKDRFAVFVAATNEALADLIAQTTEDALPYYDKALEHLQICRPAGDDFNRVADKRTAYRPSDSSTVGPSRTRIVLEIKTWEPQTAAVLLDDLAPRIRHLQPPDFLDCHWDPAATVVPLAFGVLALAMSCTVVQAQDPVTSCGQDDLAIETVELDLAERVADAFPDELQSVDVGAVSSSSSSFE